MPLSEKYFLNALYALYHKQAHIVKLLQTLITYNYRWIMILED